MNYFLVKNDTHYDKLIYHVVLINDEETLNKYINLNLIQYYKKLKPFGIGSEVRLLSYRGSTWADSGAMDKYAGMVVRITDVDKYNNIRFKGDDGWSFFFHDIEEVIKT